MSSMPSLISCIRSPGFYHSVVKRSAPDDSLQGMIDSFLSQCSKTIFSTRITVAQRLNYSCFAVNLLKLLYNNHIYSVTV